MEDLSASVGLSRPTISKYFNDPASVRPTTRKTIEAAILQSGFRPNIFAVNLNRRRTNILGVIIANAADPFYMALMQRIEAIARQAGYLCFMLTSDGDPAREDRAIETFKSMNVAGAIIAPLGVASHHERLAALGADIPLVYVDSPLDETSPFVGTDNQQSFQLIVDYLCRSGEPPCYFGMPPVNNNAHSREAAYIKAMHRQKLAPAIVPIQPMQSWDFEKFGHDEALRMIADNGGFPTQTVLCANDRIAFGVIAAAFRSGLSVGQRDGCDIRIAGHDDHPLSRYACPPITTVAQNYDDIGRLAIELLLHKLGDEDKPGTRFSENASILLPAELMIRQSA